MHDDLPEAPSAPPPAGAPLGPLRIVILRIYFVGTAVAALVAIAELTLLSPAAAAGAYRALLAAYGLLAVAGLAALRLRPPQAQRAFLPAVLATLAVIATAEYATGWGLSAPGTVFFGLICCLAGVVAPLRQAMVAAGASVLVVALLALAEVTGAIAQRDPGTSPRLAEQVLMHLAVIAAGVAAGWSIARVLAAQLHQSTVREQRFHDLLSIAASAYWETDAELRLRHIAQRERSAQFVPVPAQLGRPPWDTPLLQLDDDVLDAMRANMESRERLRDVPLRWCAPTGEWRHYLISGEPRSDRHGRFTGYWGVARDVTAEQLAHQALQRSQALLSNVVAMSPDIITLTDLETGRYEMVNDSFTRITGHPADQVVGRTSQEIGIWRRSEDRDRLLRALDQQAQAQDLDIDFVGRDGQVLPMRVSASRFERDGRAFLVINARDMTEAGRARHEREAILANASVGIAFTRDRKFVLANRQFEAMYGWPPGELMGQPGIVVWFDEADYAAVGRKVGPALGRGEPIEIECLATRRDRSRFLVRMRAKAIDPMHPAEGGTIWIAEDVTAQRQVETDLARARDQAEAANQAKSAFLANTSHEIRTPLNALVGLARLARQPGLAEGKRGLYLEQIAVSAEALSAIISDILDLSKIEAGRLDVESAPFDLVELLQSLHQAYSALADSRGLTLVLELDPDVPVLARGDAMRVRQILANYLQNALKFTLSGGVRLVVRTVPGERVRFEVHDSGPGIDAATQARLFEPFTQADESTTRRFGGTGLGLSICRELAVLMGGSVGLASQPGRGSCFYAELPLPEHHEPLRHSVHGGLDDELLSGAAVLLVEDNPVNMMIGVALLEQWGVSVTQAGDGAEALAAVAQAGARGRPFQAVLMDVQMPGMSGYEVTQALRARYTKQQLPVIALTAAALVSERERAAAVGMNDFLTKPIDARRLRSALLDALDALDGSEDLSRA